MRFIHRVRLQTAIGLLLLIIGVVVGVTIYQSWKAAARERIETPAHPAAATTQPATAPATAQAQATQPAHIADYVDVIRDKYPQFPATQPLGVPVDFDDASRIVLDAPIFLGPTGDLWITHPRAPSVAQALMTADEQDVHVVREKIEFVFWTSTDDGEWVAHVITAKPVDEGGGGSFEHITAGSRQRLPEKRAFDWSRAIYWNDRVVVPTDIGVSVLDFTGAQPS